MKPRNALTRNLAALLVVLLLGIGGYIRRQYITHPVLQGETMGTTYSITLTGKVPRSEMNVLPQLIQSELARINRQMSTWLPDSEITQFNESNSSGPHPVSRPFMQVVEKSIALSRSTGGAFDPTLNPLINLWGFGSKADQRSVPSDADIETVRQQTGWNKIRIDEQQQLWKTFPGMQLNLGAIAKGYGVDAIGQLLEQAGFKNWFVEIGGEVLVHGRNPNGDPWRIGIQYPTTNPMDQRLQGIVHLTAGAVATSGDYRNYIEKDGKLFSHILDPRSGRAVLSDTAGVTVVAPTCMEADGIATALFVMGAAQGLEWVEQHDAVEALFLVRNSAGKISEKISSGFAAATGYSSSRLSQN